MPGKSKAVKNNTSVLSESEIEKGIKVMELQNLVLKKILKEKGKNLQESTEIIANKAKLKKLEYSRKSK